jgi:hypothetical protein
MSFDEIPYGTRTPMYGSKRCKTEQTSVYLVVCSKIYWCILRVYTHGTIFIYDKTDGHVLF